MTDYACKVSNTRRTGSDKTILGVKINDVEIRRAGQIFPLPSGEEPFMFHDNEILLTNDSRSLNDGFVKSKPHQGIHRVTPRISGLPPVGLHLSRMVLKTDREYPYWSIPWFSEDNRIETAPVEELSPEELPPEVRLDPRRSFPDDIVNRVAREQNYLCFFCEGPLGRSIVGDHLVPHSKGGLTIYENCCVPCGHCHGQKGTRSAVEFLSEIRRHRDNGGRPAAVQVRRDRQ